MKDDNDNGSNAGSVSVFDLAWCEGDIDADGDVGSADLGYLLGAWGTCSTCSFCYADLTGDGQVGAADLSILLGAWGSCAPSFAMMANGEGSTFDFAIQKLGFDSVDALDDWLEKASSEQAFGVGTVLLELLND